MGQLVSDVTKILDYKESKKNAENQRQQILAQMAQDEATKTNLIKKKNLTEKILLMRRDNMLNYSSNVN